MANVDMTIYSKVRQLDIPQRLKIQKQHGIDVPFEFEVYAVGTGDNTGTGYMMATVNIGTLFGSDFYYAFTSLIAKTNDTGQTMAILCNPSHWEKTYVEGITAVDIQLWSATQEYNGINHQNQINGIMYMGRPRKASGSPGTLYIYYFDQAGVCHYRFQLSGYAMTKPMAMSNMFQPNPIG